MKLVDPSGNEVTSKENENAQQLEKQMSSKIEKLLEPVMNKVKLSGAQVLQQQLMQLSSAAQQMLHNRMIYNLLEKVGVEDLDEVLSDDDVEELSTSLKNQVQMVDKEEMQDKMKDQMPDKDDMPEA
jgi:tRNA(Glu) U13 pseudouridine synthase TruD